jgi:hypothetical protein
MHLITIEVSCFFGVLTSEDGNMILPIHYLFMMLTFTCGKKGFFYILRSERVSRIFG